VTTRDVLSVLGQTGVLIGRLAAVAPAAIIGRSRGVRAFARALEKAGVPALDKAILLARYREMVPLNPLHYRRAFAALNHARTEKSFGPGAAASHAAVKINRGHRPKAPAPAPHAPRPAAKLPQSR
jgi:hypothetical protein